MLILRQRKSFRLISDVQFFVRIFAKMMKFFSSIKVIYVIFGFVGIALTLPPALRERKSSSPPTFCHHMSLVGFPPNFVDLALISSMSIFRLFSLKKRTTPFQKDSTSSLVVIKTKNLSKSIPFILSSQGENLRGRFNWLSFSMRYL